MKQSQSSNGGNQSQSQSQSKTHVENKDNLDSRRKEEESVKGNHLTTNQKQHASLGKRMIN